MSRLGLTRERQRARGPALVRRAQPAFANRAPSLLPCGPRPLRRSGRGFRHGRRRLASATMSLPACRQRCIPNRDCEGCSGLAALGLALSQRLIGRPGSLVRRQGDRAVTTAVPIGAALGQGCSLRSDQQREARVTSERTALILGATGVSAARWPGWLFASGWRVRALNRKPDDLAPASRTSGVVLGAR